MASVATGFILGLLRRVCRYQNGNHNPQSEAGQTTQWSKEKGQKGKQNIYIKLKI